MVEAKEVEIRGHHVTLEKRVCEGGCRHDFWVLPGSLQKRARAYCDYICKRGMALNHPAPAQHIENLERHARRKEREALAGLTEKQEEIYDAVLKVMEKLAAGGQKKAVSMILDDLGYRVSDWQYVLKKVKDFGLDSKLRRYDSALSKIRTRGGTPAEPQKPTEFLPKPKPLLAPAPAPEVHVNDYDNAPQAELSTAPLATPAGMAEAYMRSADPAGLSSLGEDVKALLRVVCILKPLPEEARKRVLAGVSAFL